MSAPGKATASGAPVVVVGGSVAGLGTALFLARHGRRVVIIDRDPVAGRRPDLDALATELTPVRRATPQAAHSHIFLAGLRRLLLERAPDVLERLLAAGVEELRLADGLPPALVGCDHPALDDPELVALSARRSTLEAALRDVVLDEPGIAICCGTGVGDLLVDHAAGAPPRVRGVVLDDGSQVAASFVVDASGRRTALPAVLAADGAEARLAVDDCGITYLSRFHRLREGVERPPLGRGFTAGASFDGWSCLVFPGDHGTFSITFGVLPEDRDLRGLADPAAFAAAVAAIDLLAPWVDPARAEPLGPVATMAGLKNRVRRWVDEHGQPLVHGFASVGDAAATSNPAHSRGCSLALLHASATADVLGPLTAGGASAAGLGRIALDLDGVLSRTLVPWVEDSVEQDAARLARWRPGAPPAPPRRTDRLSNGEANAAAQHDPIAWRAFSRLQQLLDPPDAVLADPTFVAHVRGLPAAPPAAGPVAPAPAAPTHDQLAALIAATAGKVRRRGLVGASTLAG